MDHHYVDKSMCQIQYPNPHHLLGVRTIIKKDVLWINDVSKQTWVGEPYRNLNIGFATKCEVQGPWGQECD